MEAGKPHGEEPWVYSQTNRESPDRRTSKQRSANNGKKTIIVIGPVLPFRGGIAQHTMLLVRALTELSDCRVVSFKRLYPQWLFPGQSDRDPDYRGYKESGTQYYLDSLNPLTWRRAVKNFQRLQPAFVLVPWWTFFLGPLFAYIAYSLRRYRIPVVFFCHNVLDHERMAWKRALTRWVLKQGSHFVVHTRVEKTRLEDLVPGAVVAVHPHPIYDQFPYPKSKLPRRAGLELLFYGFVRPYKGLDILIEAMGMLKGDDVFLTVAGEFWKGLEQIQARVIALGIENQVEIRPRYHTNEETAELFVRADAVVLPYRSATSSGVIPIAYHYNRPVFVTKVGGLPDIVLDRQTGRILPPDDAGALAQAIRECNQAMCLEMHAKIGEIKRTLTWMNLAELVLATGLHCR